jgi:hypothetical protein
LRCIRDKYHLSKSEYCMYLALTVLYKSTQAVLGRA